VTSEPETSEPEAGEPEAAPADAGERFSYVDRVRFGDLDAMRHLNNVAFLGFFESARIAFIGSVLPDHDPAHPESSFGLIFAECRINYRSPAYFDEEIRTFITPGDVRRSSFRTEFEMRSETDGRLLAEGYGVLVGYDYAAEQACPLPAHVADRLRSLAPDVG
jgi:acyl-CoA thioester hydrolase